MSKQVIITPQEPRGPSQLVEILVQSNGRGRVPFPDVPQLRSQGNINVVIKGIRLITSDILALGMVSGLANAPLAELQKMGIVLYADGWEKGYAIPLLIFNDMELANGTFPNNQSHISLDDWQNFDWSKSYLQYSSGSSSANSPYCVMLDIEYVRLNAQTGVPVEGANS